MPTAYATAASQYATPTRRFSSTGLAHYSQHAHDLLKFFLRHRTAFAHHVQRSMPQHFRSVRSARRHLDTLVEAGQIRKVEFDDLYRSNIYHITEHGLHSCRDIPHADHRSIPSAYRSPTGAKVLHELLITETAVAIYEYARRQPAIRILSEERFGFYQQSAFQELIPDYAFLFRSREGLLWCPLEVVAGEESSTRIRAMLRDYHAWAQSDPARRFLHDLYAQHGARTPRVEFRLLCILQNRNLTRTDAAKERVTLMQSFFIESEMQRRVWTTTNDALRSALEAGSINEPVWHSGRDLLTERSRWHQIPARQRVKFMDERMRNMERYSLFSLS